MPTIHFVSRKFLRKNGLRLQWDPMGSTKRPNQNLSRIEAHQHSCKPAVEKHTGVKSGKKRKAVAEERIRKKFSDRVADLKAYQEKHGHINVRIEDDKSLASFCAAIRYARKHIGKSGVRKLSNERISSLDAIGFDWKLDDEERLPKKFSDRVADLKAYQEKHGHTKVRTEDDKSLSSFCSNIRYARKQRKHIGKSGKSGVMKLSNERISSLDAIGFDWKL
ncbi:hypothetical protein ACHAXR_000556, partial [Thalassiosira sp. AJA248-18]